jgi:transcriptional regulator with XRE-family HTH domain
MSFGKILAGLIEDMDITQKELGARLNIAPSTLSGYVQGAREPDFATLKLIADYFDVSIDYLLDHRSGSVSAKREAELLRVFRSLSPQQQDICIEQCKVFLRANLKEKKKLS